MNGEITQYQLPVSLGALTTAADGSVYIASFEGIYRAAANGEIEAVAPCPVQYCDASWIEVTPDGTILSSMGRVPPGGTLVRADIRAVDSTIDADGNVWLAPNDNVIRRIAPDGSMREVWLHDPGDRPTAIVFARDALWFSIPEAIESRDPGTELDLDLRAGDLVTHDEEQNCCFEGTHPVLAFHRRGDDGFSRRIYESCGAVGDEEGCFPYNSVLVPNPARVWFEYAGSIAAIALDQAGRLTNTLEGIDRANPSGMVVDRTGAVDALQDTYAERRLLHFAPDGTLVSDRAIAIDGARAIDLAADQCTLYYAGHGVGRVNVCTGALLAPLTNEVASDVRILHGGDVLVATRARVIRFTPEGAIVREYPGGYSIAIDLDPRFIWIGGDEGVSRVNMENGEIVERVATYGPTVSVAVVGEVRAARASQRRSAVRH